MPLVHTVFVAAVTRNEFSYEVHYFYRNDAQTHAAYRLCCFYYYYLGQDSLFISWNISMKINGLIQLVQLDVIDDKIGIFIRAILWA